VKDYYQILGVDRSADDDAIKKAYRKLASQYHPDKGGDTARFQEIQEAYSTLGDAQKRRAYDNPQQMFNSGPAADFDLNSIFEMFGTRFNQTRSRSNSTARIQLWISLHDVAIGGDRTIAVSSPAGQQNIEINIPPGIEDGNSIRYPGIAPGGLDLVVNFRVRPEPGWTRQGDNVILDVSLLVWDLILGQDIEITTLAGKSVSVKVPPKTQPGTLLRIRGHGLRSRASNTAGDLFVRLATRLPEHISDQLLEHIQREKSTK